MRDQPHRFGLQVAVSGLAGVVIACAGAPASARAAGELAPAFGGNGKVTMKLGKFGGGGTAIAASGKGKLLVAGWKWLSRPGQSPCCAAGSTMILARYQRDGTLDRRFSRRQERFGETIAGATDVAIQPGGRVLMAGYAGDDTTGEFVSDFALARYRPRGKPDRSFGTRGGKLKTDFSRLAGFETIDRPRSILTRADGKVVLVGTSQNDVYENAVAIARYNPDGSPDSDFGANGRVREDFSSHPTAKSFRVWEAVRQPGGGILVAGRVSPGPTGTAAIARFNEDGSLDQDFGTGGIAAVDFGAGSELFSTLAVDHDQRIVAAGDTGRSPRDFTLARFNPDGQLDPGFGQGGTTTTDFGGRDDAANELTLSAGRIVLVGRTEGARRTRFALARYRTDGTPDPSFGSAGRVATAFRRDPTANDAAVYRNGRLTVAGTASDRLAMARYLP